MGLQQREVHLVPVHRDGADFCRIGGRGAQVVWVEGHCYRVLCDFHNYRCVHHDEHVYLVDFGRLQPIYRRRPDEDK